MDIQSSLAKSALFGGLKPETYAALARIARTQTLEDGDTVYRIGDPAQDVFVVGDGRVRFTIGVGNRPDGRGSIFEVGDTFGWAALIEDQPRRIATALCMEDTTLIALNGAQLLAAFERDPAAGFIVMRRLAKRIARDFLEQSAMLNSA